MTRMPKPPLPKGMRVPLHERASLCDRTEMERFCRAWLQMDANRRARFEKGTRDKLLHDRRTHGLDWV